MAGNSQRRGAIRKGASKKGATVGSGGQRRRGLEGRGPTPKAEDRPKHKANRIAKAVEKHGSKPGARPSASRGGSRRGKASSEIVAGRNSVVEALRADVPVTTMYVAGRIDSDDRVREALKTATAKGIAILETPRGELDRLTDGAVHQGLALQVPPYEYAHPSDFIDPQAPGIPLVVALDGITDPRNLGAIIRSVAAFGGHGVVVPERRSVGMTASAWKTSAGAAARVPVALAANLTRALEEYRKAGFFVLGLDMDGDVQLPDLALATEPIVIVTGSEGKGLSRLVRETCDQIVSIPMSSAVESLNAGIATGVALYEVARRRAI
ncbi:MULTISPECIES: 23S rRNA (guanosine(2251)-2'-O)-methyltransferase RlmB [unclassified Phycicoccus]|uniref:23S rRNA (guanosine(2251)-2'-O)-methyltransferase RlmB n=1 Tax=unclassified Phycicoccus TaxID=2637926 RepID=UPI0007025C57|nr:MULTISPECIES: 23S rRNA (guanosine(2251)-2'-O)-methyltransferase RlmB [unclassified Phycicoccus]KRF23628.1 RNA methyltransferase [Phycicoccus sp. Soil803]KRF28392.1 RNA methyltransferase [Phycicoccus sp. Soil802]